jgi:hypothetical protein
MTIRAVLLATLLSLAPVQAIAAPIGTFGWVYSVDIPDLSSFDVTNFSGVVFSGVTVDLFAPGESTILQTLLLDDVPDGESRQSIDPLTLLTVERVRLSLAFGSQTLSVDLLASSLDGDDTLKMAAVDILAPEAAVSVPEPATWILLGSGLAALGWRRRTNSTPSSTK